MGANGRTYVLCRQTVKGPGVLLIITSYYSVWSKFELFSNGSYIQIFSCVNGRFRQYFEKR